MEKLIRSDGWAFAFNKEAEAELLKIISALSEKYLDGKVFLPHVTCFGSTESSETEHNELIKAIKKIKPFKIKLTKISFEKRIWRTLFIEVEPSPEMSKVLKIFEEVFDKKFDLNPHISLIYREDLDFVEREKLANLLKFPKVVEVNALLRYTNDSFAENFAEWETERIEFE